MTHMTGAMMTFDDIPLPPTATGRANRIKIVADLLDRQRFPLRLPPIAHSSAHPAESH
jgi:hypothetical protein